jgi:thiaminase
MRESMTADALMRSHTATWQGATVHPFLEGVRDGSLPEHSFDRWLAQDYLFAQALGLESAINGLSALRS